MNHKLARPNGWEMMGSKEVKTINLSLGRDGKVTYCAICHTPLTLPDGSPNPEVAWSCPVIRKEYVDQNGNMGMVYALICVNHFDAETTHKLFFGHMNIDVSKLNDAVKDVENLVEARAKKESLKRHRRQDHEI